MNILLLDQDETQAGLLRSALCEEDGLVLHGGREWQPLRPEEAAVDMIVSAGDLVKETEFMDLLLTWRTHPHTFLVPCWISSPFEDLKARCIWPRLTIDRFGEPLEAESFRRWVQQIGQWQQERLHLPDIGTFEDRTILEIVTYLTLRNATGRLSIFNEEGEEAVLLLHQGFLVGGHTRYKPLYGEEAFYEILSWSEGSYLWEPGETGDSLPKSESLSSLIHKGLELIQQADFLYHFIPDLNLPLKQTDLQCALDDKADPFFAAHSELYRRIDKGMSAAELVEASTLSCPRAMSFLSKCFSLGDIAMASDSEAEAEPEPEPAARAHRLLIVDDSKLMCRALEDIFAQDERFEIVGKAHDGVEALQRIEEWRPDVVTMDIEMPKMDGLAALKRIMIRNPKPVVILSAFTTETSRVTYEAFKYGAVDVIAKPARTGSRSLEDASGELRERVAQASMVRLEAAQYIRRARKADNGPADAPESPHSVNILHDRDRKVVLVGCGTGGFSSLMRLLFSVSRTPTLPYLICCVAMPEPVVEALAPNLDQDCPLKVEVLEPGGPVEPGVCYLYSDHRPLRFAPSDSDVIIEEGSNGGSAAGAYDLLLGSAAPFFRERLVSVVISGTESEGVAGVRGLRDHDAFAFTLSPEVCLKPELPESLLQKGYARKIESIRDLACLVENPASMISDHYSDHYSDQPGAPPGVEGRN